MFNIEDFKANFLGGARPNKFEIEVPGLPDKARFLLKASNIPGANLGEIIVNYQGTQAKFAGDKAFNDWEVTLILDEDYAGFNEIEAWHNLIKENDSGIGANNHNQYKKNCTLIHYSQNGEPIATYRLNGAWPKIIPDTPVAWDLNDVAMEIGITFSYDWRERIS
jgi:hypothetical protein